LAAIAVVGGGMDDGLNSHCDPRRQVPVLLIHGTTDELVNISTAEDNLDFWNTNNGCLFDHSEDMPDLDPEDGCTVEKTTYSDEMDKCHVLMYKVLNGGHTWPGAKWKEDDHGNQNMDMDACWEIWDFFKQYSLSQFPIGFTEQTHQVMPITAFPNPFRSFVKLDLNLHTASHVRVFLFNHLGEQLMVHSLELHNGSNSFTWDTGDLPAGIYFGVFKTENSTHTVKLVKMM
jgi:polyhydroxybutyrate depolymerase